MNINFRSANNCDNQLNQTIKASSSSLTRAPSWSFGVGSQDESRKTRSQSQPNSFDGGASNLEAGEGEDSTSSTKLNLEIPTVYLSRKEPHKSSYHVYQLDIEDSKSGERWSVYRRYSQFYALHQQLKAKDPAIGKLHFPPKRRLNSKASSIVKDRRRKLEDYMKALNSYIQRVAPNAAPEEQQDAPSVQPLRSILLEAPPGPDGELFDEEEDSRNEQSDSNSSAEVARRRQASEQNGSTKNSNDLDVDSSTSTQQSDCARWRFASAGLVSALSNGADAGRAGIRTLFDNFISLKERRDDHFDPSNLSDE